MQRYFAERLFSFDFHVMINGPIRCHGNVSLASMAACNGRTSNETGIYVKATVKSFKYLFVYLGKYFPCLRTLYFAKGASKSLRAPWRGLGAKARGRVGKYTKWSISNRQILIIPFNFHIKALCFCPSATADPTLYDS